MEKVYILLSACNGERYIREQLDSVLKQKYSNIYLLIRDDGSTDSTVSILDEYSSRYDNVSYYTGDNEGVVVSFYDLMKNVPDDAAYIATCDQDDVWFPDKVEKAVKALESIDKPALYCGKTQLTDENLKPIHDKLRTRIPKIYFGNAIIENICIGCTMVFNRKLYDLINGKWPKQSLIHDWWIYQVAVCFGTVIYDSTPHIYYRQHGENQIGLDHNYLELILRQVKSFKRFRGKYTAQVQEFLETFYVEGENKYLAELMVGTRSSLKSRLKILFENRIYRQGKIDTVIFKAMLFLGLL